jgi:cation diffusion facilitator CzcD-associated flavoprotein CzcO
VSRGGPRRPLRVAIIGSGLGGLAAAVKLRQRTAADFVIFEQAAGIGGTWRDNTYPGCEVDVPSHAYSYSFLKYEWLRTHATQPELLAYAEHVVKVFGLAPHLRLNTRVTSLVWEESTARYTLTTDDLTTGEGEQHEFDAVISATGLLSVPRYPDWPGLASFGGVCFHTAWWEPEHDLSGKTVAIVGTGSTAVQVAPAIAPGVSQLYVYQREPGWIEPKREREFTPRELWVYRHVPLAQRVHRAWLFYQAMSRFKAFDARTRQQREVREACVAFIDRSVADPVTRAAVTPQYPWGCKRVVRASNFYEALNRPNVELVPHEVTRVTPTGIVDASGAERPADVLILSTGFQPTSFLAGIEVKGRDGRDIHDAWRERSSAFLGITVPGFPNFFILYGPNTNGGGSIIHQLERQAEVAANAVRRLERRPGFGRTVRSIDTRPEAQRRWVAWVDHRLATTASAMESGCHNYYHAAGGANVTQWPGTLLGYALATRLFPRLGLKGRG